MNGCENNSIFLSTVRTAAGLFKSLLQSGVCHNPSDGGVLWLLIQEINRIEVEVEVEGLLKRNQTPEVGKSGLACRSFPNMLEQCVRP